MLQNLTKIFKRLKLIDYVLLFIAIVWDVSVYIILALAGMDYEDHYHPQDGPWYSLESMSNLHVAIFGGLIIWCAANIFLLCYIAIRVYKVIKA